MVRTQVYFEEEQHRALKEEARRAGLSMTELLRRVVAEHQSGHSGVERIRKEDVMSFVGLGRGDRDDVSERHDEALDEALRASSLR